MGSSCIYNNQEECDPRDCNNKNCSRSSFDKLKCCICDEIIEDVYYEINNNILCEECMNDIFRKQTDY